MPKFYCVRAKDSNIEGEGTIVEAGNLEQAARKYGETILNDFPSAADRIFVHALGPGSEFRVSRVMSIAVHLYGADEDE